MTEEIDDFQFCSRCGAEVGEEHMDAESCLRAAIGFNKLLSGRITELETNTEAMKLELETIRQALTPKPVAPDEKRVPLFYTGKDKDSW